MFRAKFLTRLRGLLRDNELDLSEPFGTDVRQRQLLKTLFKKSWVVYSKPPFAGPAKLLDYLSRYTHRVALTNSRLISSLDGKVTLTYRDRRDGDRRKLLTLPAEMLIGRFLTHVLPTRLMRIRHYGFLANRFKQIRLTTIRQLLGADQKTITTQKSDWLTQWLETILGVEPECCPCCGDRLLKTPLPSKLPSAAKPSVKRNQIRGSPE